MRLIGLAVVLALGVALAPRLTDAQPVKVPLLGILLRGSPPSDWWQQSPLGAQLRELGWREGHTVAIEQRHAESNLERLPALAAELVRLHVDVIVTFGTQAAQAAKQATCTIPIVIASGVEDPVRLGLVASLARPGGNVTGSIQGGIEGLDGKRLELLKEVVPRLSRVAVLYNPANPSHILVPRPIDAYALQMGVKLQYLAVPDANALEHAFAEIAKGTPNGLLIYADIVTGTHRRPIADFAVRRRLPTMALDKEFVEAGVLMSYGTSVASQIRRAAYYVDRILKGTKPADLPVERATKLELIINLKTAKAIGVKIPQSILGRADEVIE